jgi:FdhE protein
VARAVREVKLKRSGAVKPDPTAIGNIGEPPFARLPDPHNLFSARGRRFRALAQGHDLGPYLGFLGEICDLQAAVISGLPAPDMPEAGRLARAGEHAMPPLDRNAFRADTAFDVAFSRFVEGAHSIDMPAEAAAALSRLEAADVGARAAMVANVLADSIPVEAVAEHLFVAAVVQTHFARMASMLDLQSLAKVADGVCPACGGAPSASLIVGWNNAHGTRFCACSTCQTLWHEVRARCTLCGSTKEVDYREIEGAGFDVKAETCGACRGYVKLMYQDRNVGLDPIADDVATLGLDLLVRELGFRRGAVNPFLTGY